MCRGNECAGVAESDIAPKRKSVVKLQPQLMYAKRVIFGGGVVRTTYPAAGKECLCSCLC